MKASREEYQQVRNYTSAGRELHGWITGARALALLTGAMESGVLRALARGGTAEQIAAETGMDQQDVEDLCLALAAHGIVVQNDDSFELAPEYALLASPTAPVPLSRVLRQTRIMLRELQIISSPDRTYTAIPPEDMLAMAEGAGISALSAAPRVSPTVIGRAMPEVEALWQAGAHHLEVGCGVGNALLGIVMTFPQVSAVGIEIEPLVAAEAERRATLLGIGERVELRPMDARDLQDQEAYDTIQWSQFFFPEASRMVVLLAMRRALKPGGYLLMPWLGSISDDTEPRRGTMFKMTLQALRSGGISFLPFLNDFLGDNTARRKKERRFATLQRLLFRRWGVPVRSLSALAAEVENSGLRVVRTMPTPASQFAMSRGFLLARREAG
jgi:SAM-dependent methyltransferase